MRHRRAMCRGQPLEPVSLHAALETLADADTGHVYILPRNKMPGAEQRANGHQAVGRHPELGQLLLNGDAESGEHAEQRLGDGLFVVDSANLQGVVLVDFAVGDALRDDLVVDNLQHGKRHPLAPLVERCGHALLYGN